MKVTIQTKNDIVYITIQGSIDSNTAGELQSRIMEELTSCNRVIMDLTAVVFLSSAGLRVLLMIYRQLNAKGGKVLLVNVSEEICDIMSMTGFINFFELYGSIEEAEKQFIQA
ncbi:MAG: STAS domain-containing protein [Porphyromonadaceae bacterium]|nr:STAS domain-containing protein [Porphyromonadaceae bacterium]